MSKQDLLYAIEDRLDRIEGLLDELEENQVNVEGFRNFSNQKSITYKTNFLALWLRYPPYKNILKLIQVIFKI